MGRPTPESAETSGTLVGALSLGGEQRQRAWAELVARYAPKMYAVARSFNVDERTAEDLVQTAWLRLVERRDQLRDPEAVGAWLCMVVRNEARRVVTRRREVPTVLGLENKPDSSEPPETDLVRAERASAMRSAFARLGDECQRLLRLLLAEPALSYDEIAAAIGRPRGSLGPTRRRCLDNLRQHLPTGFEP